MQSFRFHPAVARWFEQTFGSPTEPQMRGWPAIQSGRHALISAPTGSGKTLAAFLASLDALFRQGAEGHLPDETQVVYVSPLKALSNDIRKNLQEPLSGIRALLGEANGHEHRCSRRSAHRRYNCGTTPGADQKAAAHSGYHAGVAISAAYVRIRPENVGHRAHAYP